jgi:hypothetical protein
LQAKTKIWRRKNTKSYQIVTLLESHLKNKFSMGKTKKVKEQKRGPIVPTTRKPIKAEEL